MAAVIALAVAGVQADAAQAGGPSGNLELSYVRSTQTNTGPSQQIGPVIADCNTFDAGVPLSGGNSVGSGVGEQYLNTAYPQGDGGDPGSLPDGWRVFVDNAGKAPSYPVGAAVICTGDLTPEPVYTSSSENPNPVGQRSLAVAECPDGTRVTGGGSLASGLFGEQRTSGSFPIDGQDNNEKPDDGWRVEMDNISLDGQGVVAWAVCHPGRGFSYASKRFTAKRNERTKGKALCPGDTFNVGGGVEGSGPFNSTWIVDHSTSTKFDGGPVNRGWNARMEVHTGPQRKFTVHAICHR